MGALCPLLGGLFLSHSAYAASYLNVSSSGSVSFGSIRPTSSGTSSTGSDTLTIHTDCSVGYSVYVSGQNGKDTNLTNPSASANNTISTSSNAIGSAGSLNSNTWGLNYENTGAYVGLPTYADATNVALTTKTSVDEESTVPIYYGIKVDTSITPGTYTGDVLYTVLMDSSCLAYTVVFNSNGGSGEMSNQSIMARTATSLDENTFTRSGYTFLGWSTKADGKTETAVDGVGTEADVDYSDKAEVTDLTSGGSSITLYAIWEQDVETMQGWTGCSALTTGQAVTLKDIRGNSKYRVKKFVDGGDCWMIDNLRLGYDKGYALTSTDTNITDSSTYYVPKAGYQGSITSSSTIASTTDVTFSSVSDNQGRVQYRAAGSASDQSGVSGHTLIQGTGYYNFYTTTLGCSYYGGGTSCVSGYTPRDICPKGWQLPTGNTGAKSWYYLYNTEIKTHAKMLSDADFFYSGYYSASSLYSVGSYGSWWSSTVSSTYRSYLLYLYSVGNVFPQGDGDKYVGSAVRCVAQDNYTIAYSSDGADSGEASKTSETVFQNNGAASVVMPTAGTLTKNGYEFKGWALTSGATSATYQAEETVALSTLLTAASSAGQVTTSGSIITLYPVWEALPTAMQDFICSSLAGGTSTTLRDARDNQRYSVYRFPTDVKYASTSTVANVAGKCIMTKDLNLGAVASVSGASSTIEANGKMTLSPDDSGFTAPTGTDYEGITVPTSNVTVSNGTGNWGSSSDSTDTYTNKKYTTGGTGNYAGRGYYTWGAAMVACPKNWRLPTVDEYIIDSGSWESQTGGLAAIVKGSNATTTISNITSNPYSFVISGAYRGNFSDATRRTFYWSSTQDKAESSYVLYMLSSYGLLRSYDIKYSGLPVRCIADEYPDDGNLGTMQTDGICSKVTPGHTATLTDSRDNQTYSVYHIPEDQTYAGTSTIANVAGKCIMTKDLNLGAVASVSGASSSIAASGTMMLSPNDSGFTAPTGSGESITVPTTSQTVTEGNGSWGSNNSTYNTYKSRKYITGNTGDYTGRGYYTWGAAMLACPKNWRLPTADGYIIGSGWEGQTGGLAVIVKGSDAATTTSNITSSPYFFTLSGFYSGSFSNATSEGYYWSSTQSYSTGSYSLNMNSSRGLARGSNAKYAGFTVRCIAD